MPIDRFGVPTGRSDDYCQLDFEVRLASLRKKIEDEEKSVRNDFRRIIDLQSSLKDIDFNKLRNINVEKSIEEYLNGTSSQNLIESILLRKLRTASTRVQLTTLLKELINSEYITNYIINQIRSSIILQPEWQEMIKNTLSSHDTEERIKSVCKKIIEDESTLSESRTKEAVKNDIEVRRKIIKDILEDTDFINKMHTFPAESLKTDLDNLKVKDIDLDNRITMQFQEMGRRVTKLEAKHGIHV